MNHGQWSGDSPHRRLRPARLDPAVPIEDTIGAIADMVKAGYVRHIAISEVGADTIRRAAKVQLPRALDGHARQREVTAARPRSSARAR